MIKIYKKYFLVFLLVMKISIVSSIEQPDFSELADELIPSVVSVSVIISRETVNQPRAPQFPPGSPFEDFLKIFLREEVFPDKIHLHKDLEEMKQHKVLVLLLMIRV